MESWKPNDMYKQPAQAHNRGDGRKLTKRVLLAFCAKPNDKPVEIDLVQYLQIALGKPSALFLSGLKEKAHPGRLVCERFHNLPVLSLCEAWLTWRVLTHPQSALDIFPANETHEKPEN